MVYGAACAGVRVMTSTSSPGTSLMMEGLSYIAGTEVPMVLVDVMRAGPGLANIAPSQGDYNQMVHGGGHGDYHPIVLAPASIQETVDTVYGIFDIVEKYRTIGVVLIDGSIGQMMEAVEMPPMLEVRKTYPDWAVRGGFGKDKRVLTSVYFDPPEEEKANFRLMRRWQEIEKNETRYKEYYMDGAKLASHRFWFFRAYCSFGSQSCESGRFAGRASAPSKPFSFPLSSRAAGCRTSG